MLRLLGRYPGSQQLTPRATADDPKKIRASVGWISFALVLCATAHFRTRYESTLGETFAPPSDRNAKLSETDPATHAIASEFVGMKGATVCLDFLMTRTEVAPSRRIGNEPLKAGFNVSSPC